MQAIIYCLLSVTVNFSEGDSDLFRLETEVCLHVSADIICAQLSRHLNGHPSWSHNLVFRNKYNTLTNNLLIPTLAQLFSCHHRLRHHNRNPQPSNRQYKLHFVKVLAENVKRARRRDAREEEVQAIDKDERRGLQQRWRGNNAPDVRDL